MKYLDLLGHKVEDSVTGFKGVVVSVSYDLFGYIQAVVTPTAKAGKQEDARWFDCKRLNRTSKQPVMPVPEFFGAARKRAR